MFQPYFRRTNLQHPLPKAMLVDMDGTVLSDGLRRNVLLHVALEHEPELGGYSAAELAGQLDTALDAFWSDPERHKIARFGTAAARLGVIAEAFAATGMQALTPELAERFTHRFIIAREEATVIFPGAREGLQGLRNLGVRLALITNGGADTQRPKIERFDLAPLFDHIQIEGEVGFGKPEAQAYHHAMAALGSEPHETWIVGDHLEWEVAAPQRLGLRAVWYDGHGQGLPRGTKIVPDQIIRSFLELLPAKAI